MEALLIWGTAAVLYVGFSLWYNSLRGPLKLAEVDAYLLRQEGEAEAFRAQHPQFFPDAAAVRQRLQARHGKGPTDDAPLAHG